MLSLSTRVRIFAATEPIDFRKGFDGLHAIVRDEFGEDALSGNVFLFFNARRDRVKLLVWGRNGFWVLVLDRARHERPLAAAGSPPSTASRRGRCSVDATGTRSTYVCAIRTIVGSRPAHRNPSFPLARRTSLGSLTLRQRASRSRRTLPSRSLSLLPWCSRYALFPNAESRSRRRRTDCCRLPRPDP